MRSGCLQAGDAAAANLGVAHNIAVVDAGGRLVSRWRKRSASVARVKAKPGKEAELRAAMLPLVALVRSDQKNCVHCLQEERDAPGGFIFYEIFANRADFEAHNAMPCVKTLAKLPELADGGVKVMKMAVLQGP
jgi:quinol monooxygenase YgiN